MSGINKRVIVAAEHARFRAKFHGWMDRPLINDPPPSADALRRRERSHAGCFDPDDDCA